MFRKSSPFIQSFFLIFLGVSLMALPQVAAKLVSAGKNLPLRTYIQSYVLV